MVAHLIGKTDASQPTPMMQQYLEIKAANPGSLLFYRMGDFFELFFDDAEIAAEALGIALTKRGKHLGADIPMCGVPVRTADEYLQRLIAAGHRVAVCDQTEDPSEAKKRGAKSVVRREIVRLVTPGTLTEDSLLDPRSSNYLAALARDRGAARAFGLAWIDISTGAFRLAATDRRGLTAALAGIAPRELILSEPVYADPDLDRVWASAATEITPLPASFFDSTTASGRIAAAFGVASVDGFGSFTRAELAAGAAALTYIDKTQIKARPSLSPPAKEGDAGSMQIDAATRSNLELTTTLSGERNGSLLAAIDRAATAAGSRLLSERLANPSADPEVIDARLDAVAFCLARPGPGRAIHDALRVAPDLARALARLSLDRGGPRDLVSIRDGLHSAAEIATLLSAEAEPRPKEIAEAEAALARLPPEIGEGLSTVVADTPPAQIRDGGFVRPGFDRELDETRDLAGQTKRVIAGLQSRYAEETGLRGLKIKHNNVLGYFIEVAAGPGDKLLTAPLSTTFFHRQTMAGSLRFSTGELADLAARITNASERVLAIEFRIHEELRRLVVDNAATLRDAAGALAAIDVATAQAELAEAEGLSRPTIDHSLDFKVFAGRHTVVQQALQRDGKTFVANDCDLSDTEDSPGRVWLLTGPNMAGKSTFLRQNALIAIMAQAGFFVPATNAKIGIVDRLFSRVGAADDLARGRSTFMVEMVETASILNQATDRSLVILDEIGRGTATFDGLSIAWATVENLHDVNQCRTLFATHFHELTALAQRLPKLHNTTVEVKEWKGEIAFLHRVAAGAADRSYGIQVARLAGLPEAVLGRARDVLHQLETSDRADAALRLIDDLPLFGAAVVRPDAETDAGDSVGELLAGLNLDEMTPREALEILYKMRELSGS